MVNQKKWIAALCCVLMSAVSSYALWRELGPFLAKPTDHTVSVEEFGSSGTAFGLSSYSQTLVMKDCFRVVIAYGSIDMIDDAVRDVVSTCARQAADIVTTTPSNSFAWLVRAAASIRLLKTDEFNVALRNSQLTGPNEQWIARFRVNLAETNFSQLSAQALQSETADLRLLASSERGVQLIARRYISNPDFRARITTIVEQMPQERQIVFLRNVKRSMDKG